MAKKKEIISGLNKAINSESRKEKVQAIFHYSGDELEDLNDWIEIASEENNDLNIRLLNIKEYYQEEEECTNDITLEEEREKHQKVREVLQRYNNPEYGDSIIDEICFIFGAATTTDTEEEEEY